MPHVLNDSVAAGNANILLAAAGGPGCANVLIDVQTGPDDGRVADTARKLPCKATRRGYARHFTLRIQCEAVDRARERMQRHFPGPRARLILNLPKHLVHT